MKHEITTNPTYKCAICNQTYSTIEERSACERACLKHQAEEAKRAAAAQKKAEQEARYKEVTEALDKAYDLMKKYIEDYKTYTYNGKISELEAANMDFFPIKLWHHFWH